MINNAAPGGVITLPGSDINIDSGTPIYVDKEITITTPPGENTSLNRPDRNITFPVITIQSGGRLILEGNGGGILTVSGSSNLSNVITVDSGGELVINEGVVITTEDAALNHRGIVVSGKVTMTGGTITGFDRLGAVSVENGGTFDMSGGSITNNSFPGGSGAGGVGISNGTFNMSGTAEISNNTANVRGGGVRVYGSGIFNMRGGTISGNNTTQASYEHYGAGVCVDAGGVFNMEDGIISGNNTRYSAGYPSWGAGVYVASGGTLNKTGGTIYGNDAGTANWNRVGPNGEGPAGSGHAVYVDGATPRFRDSTAGPGVNLNSGTDGGWEIE